jgi:hypothetical protein
MKQWKYKSYEEYVKSQVDGVYKHPTVKNAYNYEWFERSDITFLKKQVIDPHFLKLNKIPKFGICHGAKLGKENVEFEKQTGINFIGTDISIETNNKMKLLKWDFHKIKEGWINSVDVIYTNALDHAYDPKLCLSQWLRCLTDSGIGILEHTKNDLECTSTDPFGATLQEYCDLVRSAGGEVLGIKKFSTKKRNKTFVIFSRQGVNIDEK